MWMYIFMLMFGFLGFANLQSEEAPLCRYDEEKKANLPFTHEFRFNPSEYGVYHPTYVSVAGSFNGWSRASTPLIQEDDSLWRASVLLPDGVYSYQYYVEDSGKEKILVDLHAPIDQEEWRSCNLLYIGDVCAADTASEIGIEEKKAIPIRHDPGKDLSILPLHSAEIRVHTCFKTITEVEVYWQNEKDPKWTRKTMELVSDERGWKTFGIQIPHLAGPSLHYFFSTTLSSGKRSFFSPSGISIDQEVVFQKPFTAAVAPLCSYPAWAAGAVWYEILPGVFRNGESRNDLPQTKRWREKNGFFSLLPFAQMMTCGRAAEQLLPIPKNLTFWKLWWDWLGLMLIALDDTHYGGDIQGIREKLPYLKELGVDVLYLDPIFVSQTAHKFHSIDLRHVDDEFGVRGGWVRLKGETEDPKTWKWSESDKVFLDFVQEAHSMGFKVVLSLSLHSQSVYNPFLQDVLRRGKTSPYFNWFEMRSAINNPVFPWSYFSWDDEWNGKKEMPLFVRAIDNEIPKTLKSFLFGVTERWLAPDGDKSRGVDGFYIASAEYSPHLFWKEWCAFAKSVKEDSIMLTECWNDYRAKQYQRSNLFDGVADLAFGLSTRGFFIDKTFSASKAKKAFNDGASIEGLASSLLSVRAVDNHDTARLASQIVNPNKEWRGFLPPADFIAYKIDAPSKKGWQCFRGIVAFQMAFPGSPLVYYGDEAGMWGGINPFCRAPMWWKDKEPYDDIRESFNDEIFQFYRHLIAARHTVKALTQGTFKMTAPSNDEDLLVLTRELDQQKVYVVVNRSDRTLDFSLKLSKEEGEYFDLFDPEQFEMVGSKEMNHRSLLMIKQGAKITEAKNGTLSITIPPYGTQAWIYKEEFSL